MSCKLFKIYTVPYISSSTAVVCREDKLILNIVSVRFSNLANNQLTGTLPELTGMDALNYV